jgi:hypothetical protein
MSSAISVPANRLMHKALTLERQVSTLQKLNMRDVTSFHFYNMHLMTIENNSVLVTRSALITFMCQLRG